MPRISAIALVLALSCGASIWAAPSPADAADRPELRLAYQVEEFVAPPAVPAYEAVVPVPTLGPIVPPFYSYPYGGPVYGSVYGYVPGNYYVPAPTVIRQRTMFGPRRVRTVYRYW